LCYKNILLRAGRKKNNISRKKVWEFCLSRDTFIWTPVRGKDNERARTKNHCRRQGER